MNNIGHRIYYEKSLQPVSRKQRMAACALCLLYICASLNLAARPNHSGTRHCYANKPGVESPDQSVMNNTVHTLQEVTSKNYLQPMIKKAMSNNIHSIVAHAISTEKRAMLQSDMAGFDTAAITSHPGQLLNIHWSELPKLPNQTGVAGAFVGITGNALIVAGGANFPDGGAPWKGSQKVWYDTIYVLKDVTRHWQVAGHLPRPLGYGVSINWKGQMIIIGGSNQQGYYSEVWKLTYTASDGSLSIDSLPPLPCRVANMAGALVGDCIYIAGGQLSEDAQTASAYCWRLDLNATSLAWEELATIPGEGRMLSVAGSLGGKFFLFSGTALRDGKRVYLKDAYAYDPRLKAGKESGWKTLASLPNPVVAAPGPAFVQKKKIYVFGGDDGGLADQANELKDRHPGFSKAILSYDPSLDIWENAGNCWTDKKADAVSHPNGSIWAPVTTGLTIWNNAVIIAGGEVRPSTRTPRVLMGALQ